MKIKAKKFRGNWELVEWVAELANGQSIHPFGADAIGRISYNRKGYMAVQMMKQGRVPFASEDPFQALPEEMIAAFQGSMSYAGTYEVDLEAKKVSHHLQMSSIPNWTGQVQVRNFEFVDDKLILSTDFIGSSRHKLTWKKL